MCRRPRQPHLGEGMDIKKRAAAVVEEAIGWRQWMKE
jgi:hypothetical protein